MEQRRNERAGETGDPEKTLPPAASSGTIPTCENLRVIRPGIEPGGEQANRSATAAPCNVSRLGTCGERSQRKAIRELLKVTASNLNAIMTTAYEIIPHPEKQIRLDYHQNYTCPYIEDELLLVSEEGLGKESAMAFVRDPSQHLPGVISGNRGKLKSGLPDREWNPGLPECDSGCSTSLGGPHRDVLLLLRYISQSHASNACLPLPGTGSGREPYLSITAEQHPTMHGDRSQQDAQRANLFRRFPRCVRQNWGPVTSEGPCKLTRVIGMFIQPLSHGSGSEDRCVVLLLSGGLPQVRCGCGNGCTPSASRSLCVVHLRETMARVSGEVFRPTQTFPVRGYHRLQPELYLSDTTDPLLRLNGDTIVPCHRRVPTCTSTHLSRLSFSMRRGPNGGVPKPELVIESCYMTDFGGSEHRGNESQGGRSGASMKRRRNARAGGNGRSPRKNPLTSGIVRHDSRTGKSGNDPAGNRTWFAVVGGEQVKPGRAQGTYTPVPPPPHTTYTPYSRLQGLPVNIRLAGMAARLYTPSETTRPSTEFFYYHLVRRDRPPLTTTPVYLIIHILRARGATTIRTTVVRSSKCRIASKRKALNLHVVYSLFGAKPCEFLGDQTSPHHVPNMFDVREVWGPCWPEQLSNTAKCMSRSNNSRWTSIILLKQFIVSLLKEWQRNGSNDVMNAASTV
ncbi:hypothetical protein PR048_007885 [Dryococelus australis]|uniref:Uncharacterized protein n=1 Tax=Dryococelus australis TaxID=614101 RepID=A0ABQ9HVP7_9NEOP|nr:hypothetical protein PR048_007885 [Dryococelus australis]